jgi:glycosyltransferase involved in cell wall biosynthesis
MHICFLCNEYPPAKHGGIGSFTQTLAREFVKLRHRVTSVGLYPVSEETSEDDQGVTVLRLPQGALPYLRILTNRGRLQARLESIHRENPIDVVEGAERSFFQVSREFPVPKIIRMHGGYCFFKVTLGEKPARFVAWQERQSFAVADYVCAVSHYVGETTRELLKLGSRPIHVILNPVDLEVFQPADPALEEAGRIVYVGTVVEKKGIRQLVDAMPRIVAEQPHARLFVYGNDTLHPQTGESFTGFLRRRIPAALADHVRFEGPVRRELLPGLMARASVCVYPSHMEALPIAWVEGLAMGKAVLASQTGPGPEVIEHEVSGLLCDPHNPDSIAEGIIRLLKDENLRVRLARAARHRAENLFALRASVHENIEYYESCARQGPRPVGST